MITDRTTGAPDVVGINGIYRVLPGGKFFMTDGTDQLTIGYRIVGDRLRLRVIEVDGKPPLAAGEECPCFEMTLQLVPFIRQG